MSNTDNNDNSKAKPEEPEQVDPLKNPEIDFHGAAIIDEDGKEIPITEEMVQKACADLDEADPPRERGPQENDAKSDSGKDNNS